MNAGGSISIRIDKNSSGLKKTSWYCYMTYIWHGFSSFLAKLFTKVKKNSHQNGELKKILWKTIDSADIFQILLILNRFQFQGRNG